MDPELVCQALEGHQQKPPELGYMGKWKQAFYKRMLKVHIPGKDSADSHSEMFGFQKPVQGLKVDD